MKTESRESQVTAPTRRSFLAAALAVPAIAALPNGSKPSTDEVSVSSPNGQITFRLSWRDRRLSYEVIFNKIPVIEPSRLGIIVDGTNLGDGSVLHNTELLAIDEKYPSRGVHSQATNHCKGFVVTLAHTASRTLHQLEVRVFNDGAAFRYRAPGGEKDLRTADEVTSFTVPQGAFVWYHDFEGHYEGVHQKKEISQVQQGEWMAMPLTVKLPGSRGYAAITEAALINYAGMGLQADGRRGLQARLGHALPVSYPFRLRYGAAEGERLSHVARINGAITSPWRVIMVGGDLNTLVNCDIVSDLSPSPDPQLFPRGAMTDWIKPGRSVWKYLDGGENTLEEMKEFSRLAGELGFEYNLVEGFWQKWTNEQLRDFIGYSREHGVGVWLWKHSRDIHEPEARRQFFKQCQEAGVAGVKIDFFDHEAKEVIDLYQAALRESAACHLMVDFHGANKPAGESRTWPNEMTREGIFGLEHRNMLEWPRHNTTLPFTRMLAGHADYTVMHFGDRRRDTSWAHQIASALILTSPLLVYAAHPKNILANPAVELIRSVPSVWDETIALPSSEIGELAIFARRRGETWFLAIMNGPAARTLTVPLSFLTRDRYAALLARDQESESGAITMERGFKTRSDSLEITLRAGGGFVARFV